MKTKTTYISDDGAEWQTETEAKLRDTLLNLSKDVWITTDGILDEQDILKVLHCLVSRGHLNLP